ncbi:hypothetical protein RB213_012503 [Colletotrichum asianum]
MPFVNGVGCGGGRWMRERCMGWCLGGMHGRLGRREKHSRFRCNNQLLRAGSEKDQRLLYTHDVGSKTEEGWNSNNEKEDAVLKRGYKVRWFDRGSH